MKPKTLVCLSLIMLVASLNSTAHAQTFSVIYAFENQQNDGSHPGTGLAWRSGVLYGTTSFGPENYGNGAVYQMSQTYRGWTLTPLFQFPGDGSKGRYPGGRVVFGPDGRVYDNAGGGGTSGYAGLVFDLTPPISTCNASPCQWTEDVLHNFLGGGNPDGMWPSGDLAFDQQGNIYGTTSNGGRRIAGTIFKVSKSGNTWSTSTIWNFSGGPDGGMPEGGVVLDINGNLFGTTYEGGHGYGVVFELSYINGRWVETTLYRFQGGSDGAFPSAGLLIDNSGNLYGSTASEGWGNVETIFELMPSGNTYSFKVLYSFPRTDMQRCGPARALTMDAAGDLYGTTQCNGAFGFGNVFQLTNTQDGWVYTSLHDFTGDGDGASPYSNVTIGPDNNLYGTAAWGGDDYFCLYGCGVVWMIKR